MPKLPQLGQNHVVLSWTKQLPSFADWKISETKDDWSDGLEASCTLWHDAQYI